MRSLPWVKIFKGTVQNESNRAGEVAQSLRTFVALRENISPIPSTYMAFHNCL